MNRLLSGAVNRGMIPARAALAAPVMLASCAARAPIPAALPVCADAHVSTRGWTTYDVRRYTLTLPAGMRKTVLRGIDSSVDRYTGHALEVDVEYGPYAGQDSREIPGLHECGRDIGERPAHIRSHRDVRSRAYTISAFWPQFGPRGAFGDMHLSVVARTARPGMRPALLAIVQGVRFADRSGGR